MVRVPNKSIRCKMPTPDDWKRKLQGPNRKVNERVEIVTLLGSSVSVWLKYDHPPNL